MSRSIRTRCFEALVLETAAYIEQADNADEYGETNNRRVYGYPFIPGDALKPRQINLSAMPFTFSQGVGGVSEVTYDFEIAFVFPSNVLRFVTQAPTYFDDIDGLRVWLFGGGSTPNKNGRLADPDNAGALINNAIVSWQEQRANITTSGLLEVPVVVGFESREDRTGQRR